MFKHPAANPLVAKLRMDPDALHPSHTSGLKTRVLDAHQPAVDVSHDEKPIFWGLFKPSLPHLGEIVVALPHRGRNLHDGDRVFTPGGSKEQLHG